MKETTANSYEKRFNQVFDYIDKHLDKDLSLELLSEVARFSKFHFTRQFSAYTGLSFAKYVQFIRLKRASYQLAFRKDIRVIDIAMNAGFESAESFSRVFKKTFDQTPSQFREQPAWESWHDKYSIFDDKRINRMKTGNHNSEVHIVDFAETKVAALEHIGPPERIYESIRLFIAWRKENKLSPKISETYNIVYDDPSTTEPKKYRFDICASIKSEVKENSYGVVSKVIPGGRCAVLRHVGPDDNIGESVMYLYASWLPESGEELRNFPCFFHRVNLYPDIPAHEMITDIYLPLE